MKKEMNNKGFSLVELIIVIAIMVILIAVLAPTYLRYVERGRNARDIQNATAFADAISVWAADPQAGTNALVSGDSGATIEVTAAGVNIGGSGTAAHIEAALINAGLATGTPGSATLNGNCASRTAWDSYRITITVAGDGNVSFTYAGFTGGIGGTAAPDFAARMAGN